jgi:large subunit ribosomal protein L17
MYTNRKKIKVQGKTASHKRALGRSLVVELIRTGRIKTTTTKARFLKAKFDRLVTLYKRNTPAAKSKLVSEMGSNKRALERLDKVVNSFLMDRNSGYTRVIKTLNRKGDNAEQAYVALVNFEQKVRKSKISTVLEKQQIAKKSKRSSKSKK